MLHFSEKLKEIMSYLKSLLFYLKISSLPKYKVPKRKYQVTEGRGVQLILQPFSSSV